MFGEASGVELYRISHGIHDAPVKIRSLAKSIGCSKNYNGKLTIRSMAAVVNNMKYHAAEISQRVFDDYHRYHRIPTKLTFGFTSTGRKNVSQEYTEKGMSGNKHVDRIRRHNRRVKFNHISRVRRIHPKLYDVTEFAKIVCDLAEKTIRQEFKMTKTKSGSCGGGSCV